MLSSTFNTFFVTFKLNQTRHFHSQICPHREVLQPHLDRLVPVLVRGMTLYITCKGKFSDKKYYTEAVVHKT